MVKTASEKTVRTHGLLVLGVCVLFSAISIIRKAFMTGFSTVLMGALVWFIATVLMRKRSTTTRGTFLTQAATLVIISLSATQGEVHSMFALLAGNIAIGSIYYNLRNIRIAWVLTDAILIFACFRPDTYYVGVSLGLVIKGILGLNIAALMVSLLLRDCINGLQDAADAHAKANSLLEQVRDQMAESQLMAEKQSNTVTNVAEIAARLDSSSDAMLDIAGRISTAAEEQASSITEIHGSIARFVDQTEECSIASTEAVDAAVHSVKLLEENSATMDKMIRAMDELNDTSARIGTIIKTIEDISFQTNILALNAAVEAARAGAAGKGFAVVADEVRNLAAKSAEAAKNTTTLINESIKGVQTSTRFAHEATDQIGNIVKCSVDSETQAKRIVDLTKEQQRNVHEIKARVDAISTTISANTQTAAESAQMARSLSAEVEQMNAVVAAR